MFAPVRLRTPLLAAAMAACATLSVAQGHGGGPGGGGGMGRGGGFGGGGNMPMSQNLRSVPQPPNSELGGGVRGGLQLGPPGRWWDDKSFARTLRLDSGQQHRMDDAFNASKPTLVKLFKTLQHEESQLEKLTRSKSPEEAAIFQQIDRVTQARGEVAKAYAHMELAIRKEMTDEQISKLDDGHAVVEEGRE